jgi:hypothetical protein
VLLKECSIIKGFLLLDSVRLVARLSLLFFTLNASCSFLLPMFNKHNSGLRGQLRNWGDLGEDQPRVKPTIFRKFPFTFVIMTEESDELIAYYFIKNDNSNLLWLV